MPLPSFVYFVSFVFRALDLEPDFYRKNLVITMKTKEDFSTLDTEALNPATLQLDQLSTLDFLRVVNSEDARVATAVQAALPEIAAALDGITERMQRGGRLIYFGAGTSGRLGVLDASECPPTFSVPPGLVVGLIAGGDVALRTSVEAAEDSPEQGRADLEALRLQESDCVVGIAASGRTPYVLGGLDYARSIGALTIGLACNKPAALSEHAEISILVAVGPEVLSGSTRLKSGTAQKMVLNMLSTGAMVKLGKTYGNLMVDVRPTNAKLRIRAQRLLQQATGLAEASALELLERCEWEVKTAIAAHLLTCDAPTARQKLAEAGGYLRKLG
jgi:N-acetylmuramic acid 6-phosphate etherase